MRQKGYLKIIYLDKEFLPTILLKWYFTSAFAELGGYENEAKIETFFKKWAKVGLFLFISFLFSHCIDKYSTDLTINDKIIDVVLGSRTLGGMIEGTDKSSELWRHPKKLETLSSDFVI